MHNFVAKEIKAIYSSYDGWRITQRDLATGYDAIVTAERRNGGHSECVNILVTFAREVVPSQIEELKTTTQANDGTITRRAFAVMAPANADTSAVPAGFRIYTMGSFAFEGKELTWVKKPVRKEEAPKAST